jgi:chaperonin GroES
LGKVLKPLYDRIVVVPLDRELESDGIYLPESSAEEQKLGIVTYVGEGYVSDRGEVRPLRTKPGDIILFGIYAGIPIEIEGRHFIAMKEQEVLGVIQEAPQDEPLIT